MAGRRAREHASESCLQDVAVGELQSSALDSFRALVNELYLPLLREPEQTWGQAPEEAKSEFLQARRARCCPSLRLTSARRAPAGW